MAFFGVVLYFFSSIFAPATWWGPILEKPVEKMIFALILLGAAVTGRLGEMARAAKSIQGKSVLFYIACCMLSLLAGGIFWAVTFQLSLLLKLFMIFLAFAAFVNTTEKMKLLLLSVVLVTAMVAFQGILLKEFGVGWAGQTKYWGDRIRWTGMYNGANVLCMLFDIAMAFVLHLAFGPWGLPTRITALVCGGFIVNGIYLTNSRGGFLSLIVVVGMFFLLRKRETLLNIKLYKLVGVGIVMFGLLMVGPSRMGQINDEQHSASGRIDAWQEGIEMLKEKPIFGIGKDEWLNYHFRLAHNSMVQAMGETGLLGLFAWLAMMYIGLKSLFALALSLPNDDKDRNLAAAVLCAFMGYLAASFFITTTQFDLPFIFFGLTLALGWRNNILPVFQKDDFRNVGVMTVGGVLVVYATVRIFYATGG